MNIQIDGVIYHIQKDEHESMDVFYSRCWMIAKHRPQTQDEFVESETMSFLWRDVVYHGITFDNDMMKRVNQWIEHVNRFDTRK